MFPIIVINNETSNSYVADIIDGEVMLSEPFPSEQEAKSLLTKWQIFKITQELQERKENYERLFTKQF